MKTRELGKRADAMWRECIRRRDGGRCRRCGRLCRGHAHHLMPRSCVRTRWLFRNGVYLCEPCHDVVHRVERGFGVTEELRLLAREVVHDKRAWVEAAIQHMGECLQSGNFLDAGDVGRRRSDETHQT